jgi:GNAT superfamily N-acetyltransferase
MIEFVSNDNLDEILPLIKSYQDFYKVAPISDEANRNLFKQFDKDSASGCLFLYRKEGKAVAFATVYFTFNSNVASKVAILNDLYVLEDYRGQQIGRQLIEYCRNFALASGAVRLQWVTAPDNVTAQRLYDSLDAKKSQWAFYVY